MGRTKLRSWEDEVLDYINTHVKNIIGIDFTTFLNNINNLNIFPKQESYKPLGEMKIFIPINKTYIFKTSNDEYAYYKIFKGYEDCYYFYIKRYDNNEFLLNLLYMNYQTDLYLQDDSQSNFYIDIYGYKNREYKQLFYIDGTNIDINKKIHEFNNDNETFNMYLLKVPIDLLNFSNILSISFFDKNIPSIFYYKY